MPTDLMPSNERQSISTARWTNCEYLQPENFPTSTNLLELEELGEPITSKASIFGAISLTAFCRFVVA